LKNLSKAFDTDDDPYYEGSFLEKGCRGGHCICICAW
jgi:hypothetical protein